MEERRAIERLKRGDPVPGGIGPEDIKTIRGPWVFDFEILER